jgi:four helix bundle protein
LAAFVHRTVIRFERRYYRLMNQMLGSASSVKANIAEGHCRNSLGDYIRFCELARGSLVQKEELQQLIRLFGDATYFLEQLIKGLRAKRKEGTWDREMG